MLSLKHAYLTERFVAVFDSEFPGPVDFLLLRLGQAVGIDIYCCPVKKDKIIYSLQI